MSRLLTRDMYNGGDDKYVLHLDNFEGPLDILLDLVKRSKIDVTEIFISHITERYIEYLRLMGSMNVRIASEFVLIASELLYYKSRVLLPSAEIEDEYYIPPLPPYLVQKLIEYKEYQMASMELKKSFERQSSSFPRNNVFVDTYDQELISATLFDLINAFAQVLSSGSPIVKEEIVFDEILVSDRIDYITGLLIEREKILFSEIFSNQSNRAEVVSSLLAILEMAKNGGVKLIQQGIFDEIAIIRTL